LQPKIVETRPRQTNAARSTASQPPRAGARPAHAQTQHKAGGVRSNVTATPAARPPVTQPRAAAPIAVQAKRAPPNAPAHARVPAAGALARQARGVAPRFNAPRVSPVVQRSKATKWAEMEGLGGLGQGSCGASIYLNGFVIDGSYSDKTGFHAEMDALNQFLSGGGDVDSIETITLTSPPCKACAYVLKALGLGGKVKVPVGKGNATGHKSAFKVPDSVLNLVAVRTGDSVKQVKEYVYNI
jgi:hypothetical protein